MKMTAVKTVPRTEDQKSSRTIEDDGKARREIVPGRPIFTVVLTFAFRFSLVSPRHHRETTRRHCFPASSRVGDPYARGRSKLLRILVSNIFLISLLIYRGGPQLR